MSKKGKKNKFLDTKKYFVIFFTILLALIAIILPQADKLNKPIKEIAQNLQRAFSLHTAEAVSGTLVTSISTGGGNPYYFDVEDQGSKTYAYVANYSGNSLQIIDITEPSNPQLKDSYYFGTLSPFGIDVQGNYAYVTMLQSDQLWVLNIADPDNIEKEGSINTTYSGPYGVYALGDYAYVIYYNSHVLEVFDIATDPSTPSNKGSTLIGLYPNTETPISIYAQVRSGNTYVYVTAIITIPTIQTHLKIFDVTNHTIAPQEIGSVSAGTYPYGVYVQDWGSKTYAYVANYSSGSLQVFDVTTPTNPSSEKTIACAGAFSVSVEGNNAYVVSYSGGGITMFDVTDPENPINAGNVASPINSRKIVAHNGYVYATSGTVSGLLSIYTFNISPTVSITSPMSGSVFGSSTTINLEATASDTDGTISNVEFYQGAIKLGEDTTSPYTYTWTGAPVGTYSLTAKATDDDGAITTSAAVSIKVNASPSVNLTAPESGATFSAPASINMTATASDTDGTITKVEFYNGATKLGEDTSSPYSYAWTGVAAGTYSLQAVAFDNDNAQTFSTPAVNITVANAPPVVNITAPLNNAVYATAPASITINATASDPNGTVSKVEFYQDATKLGEDISSPYSYVWTDAAVGTYSLTAKATDNDGLTTTSAAVSIRVNALPTVSITAPLNNDTFNAPADINITATASDADGTISKVEFYNGATKLGEDTSSPYSFAWNSVASGTYSLTAKATDSDSVTATSTAVNISVNAPPTISISAPLNNAVFTTAPASISITATAADSDGTISKVEFYNGATKIGEATASPHSFAWDNVAIGSYTLTAVATDDDNVTATSAVISIRVNASPTVSITSPADGSDYIAPISINIIAEAADSDGSIKRVEFYQKLGETETKIGDDSIADPYSFTWSNVPKGLYALTAKTIDNDGAFTISNPINIVINPPANKAPTVALTSPSGSESFREPVNITLTATASDPDLEGSVTKVAFYQGAILLDEDDSAPYSYIWENVEAGTYDLTAVATDDAEATTISSKVRIAVAGNIAPSVSITSPQADASFDPPANITIEATASDSDGTVAKVEFYSGTDKLGEDTSSPYSFTWENVEVGSYTLKAVAIDNEGKSSSSQTILIGVGMKVTTPSTLKQYWFPVASYEEVGTPVIKLGGECENVATFASPSVTACSDLPASGAPIIKLTNGAALTTGTAKFTYKFTVGESGTYDFKIKVSNDSDNFYKLTREQIDYILQNDTDYDDVSYQYDSDTGELKIMEYEDYVGGLISNAKYNTFRSMVFSVYVDSEDTANRKGFIVVKGTDPSQVQEGSVDLGALTPGDHTVYLHFLSDFYFPYQSGSLPLGFNNFEISDLNAGTCAGGENIGKECRIANDCPASSCQRSLDVNPVIYSTAVNKTKPSQDIIGILIFSNPKSLDPLSWYKENTIVPSEDIEEITVDGYRAIRDDRTIYVDAANIDDNGFFYTNIYVMAYNVGAPAPTVAIFNQMLDNWVFNTNVLAEAADPLTGEEYKDMLRRDTIRKSDLYTISQLLETYKASHGGKYPTLEAGTYLKDHTISSWPSWQSALGNKLGSALPVDPLNIMALNNEGQFDCFNPVEAPNCQTICTRNESGQPLTGCPSNQQCIADQYCSICPPGYDAQTCWDSENSRFAYPEVFSGCDLPNTNIYDGALRLGGSECTAGTPYTFDGAYNYQYTSKDNGATYLLNYRLEYQAPVCSAGQCPFEGVCYQAGSCLYNPYGAETPLHPNYRITNCFLGRWDYSCGNGIVQEECGEECDPSAPAGATVSSYCDTKFGDQNWYNEKNISATCSAQCLYEVPEGGAVESYSKDPNVVNCGGYCGDKIIQPEYQEKCDQGVGGGAVPTPDIVVSVIDGQKIYGSGGTSESLQYRCSINCQPEGGYCGDGVFQPDFEQCDKAKYIIPTPKDSVVIFEETGIRPSYACGRTESGKDCQFTGGYCGDGITQDKYGETCDDRVGLPCVANSECGVGGICSGGICTSKNCSKYCRGTYCGNGVVERPNSKGINEICDWGIDPLCSQDCQHLKMGGTCNSSIYDPNPCNPQSDANCKLCDANLSCSVRKYGDIDLKCLGTRGSIGCRNNNDCIMGYYCDAKTAKCEPEISTYLRFHSGNPLSLLLSYLSAYVNVNPTICPSFKLLSLGQDKSAVYDFCTGLYWDSADKIDKDRWSYSDAFDNACVGIFKMPTINELYSLVSQTNINTTGISFMEIANTLKLCGLKCAYNPSDVATLCINCGDDNYIYWSSTCSEKVNGVCKKALAVNFKYGSVEEYDVNEELKVHCKRQAQCGNGTLEEDENCEFYVGEGGNLIEQKIDMKCTNAGYDGGFVHCDPLSCTYRYDNCYLNSAPGVSCNDVCQSKKSLDCISVGLNIDTDYYNIENGQITALIADDGRLRDINLDNTCVDTENGAVNCASVMINRDNRKCQADGQTAPFASQYTYCRCEPGAFELFNCLGQSYQNASLCSQDGINLLADTQTSLVSTCTDENKCEYTCNNGYFRVGTECQRFQCLGDDPANASLCPGDDELLSTNTEKVVVDACSAASGPKCEYTCNSGHHIVDGACAPFVCLNQPSNALLCVGDDQQLISDINSTVYENSDSCTDATKCEYFCESGYVKSGSECVPATCQGEPLDGWTECNGDSIGLPGNVNITLVATCTDLTKCEYVCNSNDGYIYKNGACFKPECTGTITDEYALACSNDDPPQDGEDWVKTLKAECTADAWCEYECATPYVFYNDSCCSKTCDGKCSGDDGCGGTCDDNCEAPSICCADAASCTVGTCCDPAANCSGKCGGPNGCGTGDCPNTCTGGATCAADNVTCESPIPPAKIVFVTNNTFKGGLGGVSGANSKCQTEADSALGTGKIFKAWISTESVYPNNQFNQYNGPYKLVDGTTVADNYADLIDGSLDHPINMTAFSSEINLGIVAAWTNVSIYGVTQSPYDCGNWTSYLNSLDGRVGLITALSASWTNGAFVTCDQSYRLYCFEQ